MSLTDDDQMRLEIVNASKKIYSRGLVQAGEGNLSLRIPGKDEMFITPTYNSYEDLVKANIVHIKFDGIVMNSTRQPSSEYRLHADLYKARPKVMAIIHTHSPYATMLSAARLKIPVLIEEQVIFLGGHVDVSEFASAHTEEFSKNAIKGLGTRNATLMANHGVLACGKSMSDTIKMAELVEKLAWIYYGAKLMGGPVSISDKSCPMFIELFEEKFATHENLISDC